MDGLLSRQLPGSLDVQLPLNPEFFNAFSQGGAGNSQQFGGMYLVVIGLLEGLNNQLAFNGGNDFKLVITPGQLKKLPGQDGRMACSNSRTLPGQWYFSRARTTLAAMDFGGRVCSRPIFSRK